MTNSEYLSYLLPEVPSEIATAVMTGRGVEPSASYDSGQSIRLAEADLYERVAAMPDLSQGQLSVSYDREQLNNMAQEIYKLYNDPKYRDWQPKVQSVKL